MEQEKKFLDSDELAEYIHMSKSFIYKKVFTKTIPFVKLGKRTIFVKEQIDQWVINSGQMGLKLPDLGNL
ncbi:MAG: helix-turn-helix domain-containing protein [Candidatus Atribacteria bacterium]|nr:helix-turn-helix domain-containing protein [Candidatus Atribacteria bacterium]